MADAAQNMVKDDVTGRARRPEPHAIDAAHRKPRRRDDEQERPEKTPEEARRRQLNHMDIPVIMGSTFIIAFFFIIINILVDITHLYLDPRIKHY